MGRLGNSDKSEYKIGIKTVATKYDINMGNDDMSVSNTAYTPKAKSSSNPLSTRISNALQKAYKRK